MPTRLVIAHFRPLNQLLQWLQCLSSEETLGGLIDTLQNLQSLNPMQLLRAARDYRYEVDESRLRGECAQYLTMMLKDWENQRMRNVQVAEDEAQSESEESSSSPVSEELARTATRTEVEKHIDDVFASPNSFLDYEPPTPPESLGELLDSRYMVNF
jgi:DIL domain